MAASVDSNGILNEFVRQPSNSSPSNDSSSGYRYRESWKGPYSTAKELLKNVKPGSTTRSAFLAAMGSRDEEYAAPTALSGNWYIDSVEVDEQAAGDHCIINVQYKEQENAPAEPQEEDGGTVVWNCTMVQSTVNVLAYCTNKLDQDGNVDLTEETYAARIQSWHQQSLDTSQIQSTYQFQSALGIGKIEELNEAEVAIAKKLQAGKNPMRHYPQLTKTISWNGPPKDGQDKPVIDQVDIIDTPQNCPYDISKYEWLLVGDTWNYDLRSNTTQHTLVWIGSWLDDGNDESGWDKQFYDPTNRWQFGNVTVSNYDAGGNGGNNQNNN